MKQILWLFFCHSGGVGDHRGPLVGARLLADLGPSGVGFPLSAVQRVLPSLKLTAIFGPENRPFAPKRKRESIPLPSIFRGENVSFRSVNFWALHISGQISSRPHTTDFPQIVVL